MAASPPRILAEASGFVVAEDGAYVVVVDRGLGSLATAAFVLTLLTVIPAVPGLVVSAGALADGGPPPAFGYVLLLVSSVAFAGLAIALRALRVRRARPISRQRAVAVLDRAEGVLRDTNGQPVAPLAEVRIARRMQLASSSPKLVAEIPAGPLLLARGNPFAGGLGRLEEALNAALERP